MVDSVKNYGLKGLGSDVQIGKRNARIIDETDQIALRDKDGVNLVNAVIADGVISDDAVTKAQMNAALADKVKLEQYTVTFDSGVSTILQLAAGSKVFSVSVEGVSWNNTNGAEEVLVGDAVLPNRLFSGFDKDFQVKNQPEYIYTADTDILVTVTPGSATSGTVKVLIMYYGQNLLAT